MQRIMLMCVLFIIQDTIMACDICSCTSMGNSLGILPKFNTHFIGLRHTNRSFQSFHPVSILQPEGSVSNENYKTTELWGRWVPHERIQAFAFIPFNTFSKKTNQTNENLSGLGDISLLLNYRVFKTNDTSKSRWHQALYSGFGIKLNTGSYNPEYPNNFQLGSAAKDLFFNLTHTIRYSKLGFQSEANYRKNGENQYKYRLGEKYSLAGRLFAWLDKGRFSFLPYLGYSFEQAKPDELKGIFQDYTGSNTELLSIGAECFIGNIQCGVKASFPQTNYQTQGTLKTLNQFQFQILYHFNSKN